MIKVKLSEENKAKVARFILSLKDGQGEVLPNVKDLAYPDEGHYLG